MKRINLEIKALSPLAIGKQKPGSSIIETERYIPGSVIRGAVAAHILKFAATSISEGDDFQRLFLGENPAIFQNAYPAIVEGEKQIRIQPEVRVIPNTALSSKNKPGFKSKKSNHGVFDTLKGNHGVFDTLIDRLCAEYYDHPYDPNCPVDGARVDTFTGFYSQINDKYYSHSATTRLLTRVGINRRRATSEDQVLYSIEVLNESQDHKKKPVVFIGAILVVDELAEALQNFIHRYQQYIRLGGATSRGLGRVEIKASIVEIKPKVTNQIQQFNDKLRKRWDEWKIFGTPLEDLPGNRTYFTIDLQSDAIFSESWRRTTVISEEMLQQFTGVRDSSLLLHAAYSSYDYLSGWNSAWGLMKDVELITNKGAVYLFSFDVAKEQEWFDALDKLELNGVGERTAEGFGQVRVCDNFHLILREEAK